MTRERWLSLVGIVVVTALLVFVFQLYLRPDMILEFSNLLFCG